MAVQRDQPYGNFNFIVDLGGGIETKAGFSEVVLPEILVDVVEYRAGGEPESGAHKLPGRARYPNAILRRGVTGALTLYEWIDAVRNGAPKLARTVTISLQNEDRSAIVWTWKLLRAWPARYSFGLLDATGKSVLVETLELAYERLEIE